MNANADDGVESLEDGGSEGGDWGKESFDTSSDLQCAGGGLAERDERVDQGGGCRVVGEDAVEDVQVGLGGDDEGDGRGGGGRGIDADAAVEGGVLGPVDPDGADHGVDIGGRGDGILVEEKKHGRGDDGEEIEASSEGITSGDIAAGRANDADARSCPFSKKLSGDSESSGAAVDVGVLFGEARHDEILDDEGTVPRRSSGGVLWRFDTLGAVDDAGMARTAEYGDDGDRGFVDV